jgi:WD40 repeat protein/DNA-binding SARP family transcriptional activator
MDFHILGPLEALDQGRVVTPRGTKQRALLALFLVHANEPLSTDRLIDELWGERPPATAAKNLQVHISQLRKALAHGANGQSNGLIVTRRHSYELKLDPEQLDSQRFQRLVADGSGELEQGRPERAASALEGALSLWRGPALADVAYEPFAVREVARLDDLRIAALEHLIDAKLELARHEEVVPELQPLIREHPYRERLRAQLMLALYRCDRQADALQAYQDARKTLVGEIGIEPGEHLRELERAILAQDPALAIPALESFDLPPELETGTLLVGRDRECEWLREQWSAACRGAGRIVLVAGARGMGKTRLAGELAGELHQAGDRVLYLSGAGPREAAQAVLTSARQARRPTLLVFDDVDRADQKQLDSLDELVGELAGLPLLVLVTSEDGGLATRLNAGATLDLRPLDLAGVGALARLYAEGRADAEMPVEELAKASGGVPQRVHRAASAWARGEASRRLGIAADRAATERTDLRMAEDELEGSVVELQSLRARAEPGDVKRELVTCPFKGLALFDVADAEVFFGRERLVAEMVARLAGAPLMGIVGPSGSGKSSALRAGLLASLAAGVLPGSERWALALLRPGEHPLRALERAVRETVRDGRLVIAVDQFEEVFTACQDESERAAFVDSLVSYTRDPGRQALVLVAIRADFYGRCAAYPELSRLLGANNLLVGPMRRHELRHAIELPARRAGLRVDPELAEALVEDIEGEPGGLPLLSTSLLELWQRRDGRRLRLSAYENAGGVHGAVARLADSAYERLDTGRRLIARRILLRLAGEGEGEAIVRRRVPLSELEADRDQRAYEVLLALAGDRLVTIGEGEAEVAHEALLREWPRLQAWLEEDAEGRRLHRHLIHAARDWDTAARDASELYRGARLAFALDWVDTHEQELNSLEREFIAASRSAAEGEAERQRGANRRLRALLAGVAALLALAVVAGVVALGQRSQARDAARVADAQRLGAEALNEDHLDRALLLARTGVDLDDTAATRSRLLSVLMRTPAAVGAIDYGWGLYSLALSPDARTIALGDERGAVTFFDATTRRQRGRPYYIRNGLIQALEFSRDGRTLAVSSSDPTTAARPLVDLIDARTGTRKLRMELPAYGGRPPFAGSDVTFLPTGRDLVIHTVDPVGDRPSVLYRVNGTTGVIERRLRLGRHSSAFGTSTTADRRRLFVTSESDDTTWVLDPERLIVTRSYPVGDSTGVVSPNGRVFALGSPTGHVRLLDLRSGTVRLFNGGTRGSIDRMRFTPDGRTLVTVGAAGRVLAWNVATGNVEQDFTGHRREVRDVDISGDGRTMISAGSDTRAIVWDLAGNRRLDRRFAVGRPFNVFQTPRGIAVSPDGRTLALTHSDGAVDLIDTRTLRRRASVRAIDGVAASVDFSPDGRLLAVTGNGGRVTLWNARTLAPAGELRGMRSMSQALAFSPDGRLLAAAEGDVRNPAPMRVWDVRRRTLTAFRARTGAASALGFSPDGRLIAVAAIDHGTELFDARTGRLVKRLGIGQFSGAGDFSRSVAFSPDGRMLFVGQYDGRGYFYSTKSWKRVGQPVEGHTGRITFPEFSSDGRMLVTASADGTVVLWDVATRKPIGSPLALEPNTFASAVLSPDGSRLFAISTRGRGISFDISPKDWNRHACLVAGHDLTAREWRDALPGRPYRAVCHDERH